MIVGIPSNDFGSQEPGEATEIADTANRQYSVTFPMASKTVLEAADARPSYKRAL
jgi:glutathione peroxidase